ncbi:MAG: DNA mismatch repair endonuclease MutL [Evtepia sp.]
MPIQVLDTHVADLIAAGEVVERPASVVKELIENALDAAATQLTIEISHGGMSMIRVTDNGSGIPFEEAETAFLRHATSKLHTAGDLEAIGTLGFRGEALAAIAAVSRLTLFSRTPNAPFGVSLSIDGGIVTAKEEAGCPFGTTIVIRDLFFNTPARLKFMKRDASEGAAVFAAVQRLALSQPEVSIQFFRDGTQELLTPGDGKLASALYSVLGRDLALGFVPAEGSGEDIQVSGFVSMPTCCRGTRGYQHFFVNGRQIRSRLLTAALEEAYRNQKMVGRFPGCVLHVTMKKNALDVNVHPAKTEVKFLSDKKVFSAVHYTVLSALGAKIPRPTLDLTPPTVSSNDSKIRLEMPPSTPAPKFPVPTQQTTIVSTPPAARAAPPASPPTHEQPLTREPLTTQAVDFRMVGEVFKTYIVVEQNDAIFFIDKHAAHERIQFDRMKSEAYQPMSQELLAPLVFTPSPEECTALLDQIPLLSTFGFVVEDFGGGALMVRALPFDLAPQNAESALCELAAELLTGEPPTASTARDALLHTMACKAAIRGGETSSKEELLELAAAVMSDAVRYCPHGRPVATKLTRSQLEKQFKRT